MKARLKNLTMSLDGGQELTLALPGDWRENFQALKDHEVDVEIKRWRAKKSLSANGLLWSLCREVGNAMRLSDVDVYRKAVREVGVYEYRPIKNEAVETFEKRWERMGLAWFCEVIDDSKLIGYKKVKIYYGSSVYTGEELSALIDYIMDDAKQIGITPKASKEQIETALRIWGENENVKNN